MTVKEILQELYGMCRTYQDVNKLQNAIFALNREAVLNRRIELHAITLEELEELTPFRINAECRKAVEAYKEKKEGFYESEN